MNSWTSYQSSTASKMPTFDPPRFMSLCHNNRWW